MFKSLQHLNSSKTRLSTVPLQTNEKWKQIDFYNPFFCTFSGQLPVEGVIRVLESLREQNRIEWMDPKTRKQCLVYWRTLEEWANLIYKYVQDSGLTNTVCTLFELTSGDDTKKQGEKHFCDTILCLPSIFLIHLFVFHHQNSTDLIRPFSSRHFGTRNRKKRRSSSCLMATRVSNSFKNSISSFVNKNEKKSSSANKYESVTAETDWRVAMAT